MLCNALGRAAGAMGGLIEPVSGMLHNYRLINQGPIIAHVVYITES